MGWPHCSHRPYVPASIFASARSISSTAADAWALSVRSRSRSTFMVAPSPDSSSNWMSPGSISSASCSASSRSDSAWWVYVARSSSSFSRCLSKNFCIAADGFLGAGVFTGFGAGADFAVGAGFTGTTRAGADLALVGALAFTFAGADLTGAAPRAAVAFVAGRLGAAFAGALPELPTALARFAAGGVLTALVALPLALAAVAFVAFADVGFAVARPGRTLPAVTAVAAVTALPALTALAAVRALPAAVLPVSAVAFPVLAALLAETALPETALLVRTDLVAVAALPALGIDTAPRGQKAAHPTTEVRLSQRIPWRSSGPGPACPSWTTRSSRRRNPSSSIARMRNRF